MAKKPVDVSIVVTVNHIYLPLDDNGNGRADWAAAQVTMRVDKRTRLKVPADLARFLSDRDQVEILSAPLLTAALGTGKADL
jgi:hypothetical protein